MLPTMYRVLFCFRYHIGDRGTGFFFPPVQSLVVSRMLQTMYKYFFFFATTLKIEEQVFFPVHSLGVSSTF